MKIALIHATALSIAPIEEAFAQHWPQVELVNILDDSLSRDRKKSAELTDDMFMRIAALAEYAERLHVDAILYTCSAFSAAITAVAQRKSYPVLSPNESMLKAAVGQYQKIGVVSSFAATAQSISSEIKELADMLKSDCEVFTSFEPNAMQSLALGDTQKHNELLLNASKKLILEHADIQAILLAQYSTSHSAALISSSVDQDVLTPCEAAVQHLRQLLL